MKRKKRRRLKKGRITLVILFFAIIFTSIYYRNDIIDYINSNRLGYEKETIALLKEEKLFDKIKDKEYSKTLEVAITTDNYNNKYFDDYYEIEYVDKEDFVVNINSLLDLGYSTDNINTFYDKLTDNSINIIIDNKYNENLINYLNISYFNEDYLERYLLFYENDAKLAFSPYINGIDNDSLTNEDIITYVNANLDNEYYTNYKDVEGNNLYVLVNKYNKLASDYVPDNLEVISSNYSYGTQKLVKEAKEKFEEMCTYMRTINLYLVATSTYRSYSYQTTLYNNYVYDDGKANADTYSARPGFSEHQTGLAVDVGSNSNSTFFYTNEYKWMVDNSYKYGFILRYPKGKEHITGYMFESWHYRYLGVDEATKVYESGLTYDEYVARKTEEN